MSMTLNRDKHPAGIHCKHCGEWHYAYSYIDTHTALDMAQRKVELCGNNRRVMGLPDAREAVNADR